MRRPTIKDVARVAGVTYPTVSRVLSNKPYVSAETREKVMRAVDELGYRPSVAARSMVTNRTQAIAMMVPTLTDPNFGEMVAGAERVARTHNYSVLVAGYQAAEDEYGFLTEHRVDGLLLAEPQRFSQLLAAAPPIPTVAMDDVTVDNRGGGRAIGRHLRELGHRRVIFLGGPPDSPYAHQRHQGLRDVLGEVPWLPGDWTAESGFALAMSVLEEDATAIACANDFVAFGAINALTRHGVEVPAQVSVTGFDDIALARHFRPALTTVAQDLQDQGARAATLLFRRLAGETLHLPLAPKPLDLIVRESSGHAASEALRLNPGSPASWEA